MVRRKASARTRHDLSGQKYDKNCETTDRRQIEAVSYSIRCAVPSAVDVCTVHATANSIRHR